MKRVFSLLGLILTLGAMGIWWFSPEQTLKRRVSSMLETAEVPPSMIDAGRKARGTHLAKYLAKQISVNPPEGFDSPVSDLVNRDTASALYSGAAAYCKEITFTDLKFDQIFQAGDQATVRFNVDAIVALPSRRPVDGILHVETEWKKTDGDWLLQRFSWTESPR